MAEKVTLQNRITTFMVILTIVIIAAFTAIQVYNQLNTITLHNQFRGRLGTIIAKNNFETVLQTEEPPEKQISYLKHAMASLTESEIIDSIDVYDTKYKLVATTGASILKSAAREDVSYINESLKAAEQQKWFLPKTEKRALKVYIPLASKGAYTYVAKLNFSLGNMMDALKAVYFPVIFTAFVIIGFNTGLGYFLAKNVIGPIRTLDVATEIIADGNLEHRVDVKTGDELEDLAERFNRMTVALIKMKERAENANPLTKLPGNVVIREETENRISQNKKFVAVHTDLDNFKAYNDKYGLAKGDEAIKICRDVLKEGLEKKGNPEDFLGHEGGDDFVYLTTPEKADDVANFITSEFDKRIINLYSAQDREKGYIEAKSRQGVLSKFPIMAISLAGVSNQYRTISSYVEVTNITAEVKKKAKAIEGSVFVLDKRTADRTEPDKET